MFKLEINRGGFENSHRYYITISSLAIDDNTDAWMYVNKDGYIEPTCRNCWYDTRKEALAASYLFMGRLTESIKRYESPFEKIRNFMLNT